MKARRPSDGCKDVTYFVFSCGESISGRRIYPWVLHVAVYPVVSRRIPSDTVMKRQTNNCWSWERRLNLANGRVSDRRGARVINEWHVRVKVDKSFTTTSIWRKSSLLKSLRISLIFCVPIWKYIRVSMCGLNEWIFQSGDYTPTD